MKRFFAALVAAFLLSACTIVDMHRAAPDGWPRLVPSVQRVGFGEANRRCGGGILYQTPGCSIIDFVKNTCTIITSHSGDELEAALEHETEHCNGREHIGSNKLHEDLATFERWRLRQPKTTTYPAAAGF